MTTPIIRLAVAGGLCLVLAGLSVGGAALPVREPRPAAPVDPDGRTVTVCPAAPTVNLVSTTTWGALSSRPINDDDLAPVPAGRGATLTDVAEPVLMIAEGRQNTGAAASAYARHPAGPDRGLSLARCGTPATSSWFTGLVSNPDEPTSSTRTEVVLINADAGAAEADLVLFGPTGLQVAPGARGIAVPGRSARTVALETLFTRAEPVGVQVRSSRGRVAAVIQQRTSAGAQPAGTDWQVAAAPPAQELVVAGIAGGAGQRTLVLTNPGKRRTTATIEVLGPEGPFAPADAATLDVNAESTAQVPLHQALDGEPATVRITAEQPLAAAVVARGSDEPDADIAVQPASAPLSATSIGALAVAPGVRGALLVANAGDADAVVPVRLVGTDGAELMATDLRVPPGTTVEWGMDQVEQPAGVQVAAPAGSELYAGLALTSGADPAAGLATTPLSVPQTEQGGGIEPAFDPGAGR
ncbi:MAG: DUF5719 family protein [Propionibacteriaceae bacterium]|nr:DUF5719 family protein [Propionibacteriaceae bacterium]